MLQDAVWEATTCSNNTLLVLEKSFTNRTTARPSDVLVSKLSTAFKGLAKGASNAQDRLSSGGAPPVVTHLLSCGKALPVAEHL